MRTGDADLATTDGLVTQMSRSGEYRVRSVDRDPMFPLRTTERLQQLYGGVPIFGVDIVRESEGGSPRSIFGTMVNDLRLSVRPEVSLAQATDALTALAGAADRILVLPTLAILPVDTDYRLVYGSVISSPDGVFRVFLDARTGIELSRYSEIQQQSAIGQGRGVLGDLKKISTLSEAGAFFADDQLRPPTLRTFDLRGNLVRLLQVNEGAALFASDRASDTDNDWDDVAAVDAHVNIGRTYDYYFKRFGRRGIDGRDRPIVSIVHGVTQQAAVSLPPGLLFTYALNAYWCGVCGPNQVGLMFFGDGLPSDYTLAGQRIGYLAGGLDIAAHELTHGVTDSSSQLIYRGESGALNEAFSDIIGTSVEFFYQSPGAGVGLADYLLGEDVYRASRPGSSSGIRSMENPAAFGDPDHYSRRYLGTEDSGGVHINSGIANHAYYLAIEGGTNRTSGLAVQGVGTANRADIEKTFYRAFVFMLPMSATFSQARAATIQAARDLYGPGSNVERAVTEAWIAVGVN